jgi:hypothetical protein
MSDAHVQPEIKTKDSLASSSALGPVVQRLELAAHNRLMLVRLQPGLPIVL